MKKKFNLPVLILFFILSNLTSNINNCENRLMQTNKEMFYIAYTVFTENVDIKVISDLDFKSVQAEFL